MRILAVAANAHSGKKRNDKGFVPSYSIHTAGPWPWDILSDNKNQVPKLPFKPALCLLHLRKTFAPRPNLPQLEWEARLPSTGFLTTREQWFHCNVFPKEKKNPTKNQENKQTAKNHPTICLSACDRENFSCCHQPWSSFTYWKDVQLQRLFNLIWKEIIRKTHTSTCATHSQSH